MLAFVLNILPVPGLDGFAVLEPFLPNSARRMAARVRPWAPIALFVLILGVPGVASALFRALVFSAVGGDADLAATGYSALFFWAALTIVVSVGSSLGRASTGHQRKSADSSLIRGSAPAGARTR